MNSKTSTAALCLLGTSLCSCALPPEPTLTFDRAPTSQSFRLNVDSPIKGCLGAPLDQCIADIQATGPTKDYIPPKAILDVNGKDVSNHGASINYYTDDNNYIAFGFFVDRHNIVESANAVLFSATVPLNEAETQDDYDKTHIYTAAHFILGNSCPIFNKQDLYKFFHNNVKPKLHMRSDSEIDLDNVRTNHQATVKTKYCGYPLKVHSEIGYDSSHIDMDSNPTGVYSIQSLYWGKE